MSPCRTNQRAFSYNGRVGAVTGFSEEKPPPSSRTPQQAERCLRADGFEVRRATVNVRRDRDAPDEVLFATRAGEGDPMEPGESTGAEVGFYKSLPGPEAEPGLRENAKRFDGEVERGGRATIVWFARPDDGLRDRVWRCVFAG